MPQDGHWLASFEVILPQNVSFSAAKSENPPLKSAVADPKNLAFSVFSAKILSRRSRLSRTSMAPSRLILPRPIDCDSQGTRTDSEDFPAV